MEASKGFASYFVVVFLFLGVTANIDTDFTIDVKPGYVECFYQTIKKETPVEVEYQVIDGGDLDIGFMAYAPGGQVLFADNRKTENVHRFDAKSTGDYKFCLDNSFSRISHKMVFFELMTDEDDDSDWTPDKDEITDLVDMTIEDFKTIMTNVKSNLEKSQQIQNLLKQHEARDRNIQENNFTRVNFMSGVSVVVMLIVGLTQVVMIRNLFADRKTHSMKSFT